MTGSNDDVVWVARCLQGEQAAFETLVRRYQGILFKVAYRLTANREDARDVAQNAFIRAFERLETYDPSRKFFSWIYRIAVNESLNYRRQRHVHDDLDPSLQAARGADPIEQAETADRVQTALMALTPEYREVIVMRYFGELSYEEISHAIGIPEKTVKSRLFTARERLGRLLDPGGSMAPS
jgi:RNA polymerase sigma-70 factor (ECF subfamily)